MEKQFIAVGLVALACGCVVVQAEDKALAADKAAISQAPVNELFREGMSELVLRVDYENGCLTNAGQGVVAEGPAAKDAFFISDKKARSGKFSLRTKVAGSNDYVSYGKHRAETTTMGCKATRYNEGDVFRYRFSFMLQDDWEYDSRDSLDIIWQFKRFDGGPDMFIATKGKDIVLRCGRDGQWTLVRNYVTGEWLDVCLIVRWSSGTNGFFEAYSRRAAEEHFKPVASFCGGNTRDDRPNSTYLTWGIYKPDMDTSIAKNPRVIYHDDIIVERMTGGQSRLQATPNKLPEGSARKLDAGKGERSEEER